MAKLAIIPLLLLAIIASVHSNAVANAAGKRVVCYYGSWAVYRHGLGKYDVENIDPMLCTHLIYGFTGLADDNTIRVMDDYNDEEDNWRRGAFRRFTDMKKINPNLKTLLAIGGWNEGTARYSRMVSTAQGRRTFIESTIPLLTQYDFDGLDLDWEYPSVCTDIDCGKPEDKANFVQLLREMKPVYEQRGWLLTAAVSAGEFTIEPAYDIPQVAGLLDFINVMTYDFRGAWRKYTGHHSPLNGAPFDIGNDTILNSIYAMDYWIEKGAPASKLNLGLGTYGRGWLLDDANEHGFYAPANEGIPGGPYTSTAGFWGYNELMEEFAKGGWTVVRDPFYHAPYAYKGRYWIGYDDPISIAFKSRWALDRGLGGVMVWSVETDDFHGLSGETNPLIKTMYRTVIGDIPNPPTTTTPTPDPSQPTTTTTRTTTTTPPPDGECKEEGQRIGEKCDKIYYVCTWNPNAGKWDHHQFSCAVGLSFDPTTNSCNWDHIIGC